MQKIWKWEAWKYNNCFDESKALCQDCCSGGGMVGAFCKMREEKYKEIMDAEELAHNKENAG